jgi:putative aldouronate transport system substrate-binding protein
MKKKIFALLLVVVMMGTLFVGCGTSNQDNSNDANDQTNDSATGKDKVVTLKWVMVGNGMPSNYEAWQKNINAYLEDKIGVNIDVEVVSWGDWDNRRNVIVNSGEYFDILFTDVGRYLSEAQLGTYYDITKLVKENASDLYKYIPENYWEAVKVDGKIYSIPTYKDSSVTQYFVWDKGLADKYDIDIQKHTTLKDLTEPLRTLKEGEGTAPFIMDKVGLSGILTMYDGMGAELEPLGVRIDDETRTVVNVLKEEQVMNDLKTIHQWYKEGIINADAPTLAELPTYRMVFMAQGWPSAAKTTWGPNMGVEAEAVQHTKPVLSNGTVRGSLNGIYSGSKHPEKALEFLQLVNLDSHVRDAFYYGLEGDNFKYTEDGKVERLNSEWSMAGYTQGTFFTVTPIAGEVDQWEEVKELNEQATGSVLLGFDLDPSNIQNELANCRAVWNKYKSELLTGARNPEELVETVTTELEAAGFNKIIEEAQNQINANYNK